MNRVKQAVAFESILTDKRWRKKNFEANFTGTIQKYLTSIWTAGSSESVKNAMNELEREFLVKYDVSKKKERTTLISIFGVACKYICELLKKEGSIEKIHLLRGLINIAIVLSKDLRFQDSALWKIHRHVPFASLFQTGNIEFLRLASSFLALRPARRASNDDDPKVVDSIVNQLLLVDDITRACLVMAGKELIDSGYFPIHHVDLFDKTVTGFLSMPDVSLCKLMAVLYMHETIIDKEKDPGVASNHIAKFIEVLADYVKWCDEYETSMKEILVHKVLTLPNLVSSHAKMLKGHEISFLELSLNNLKQLNSPNSAHCAVEMLLLYILESPLVPGVKIIDLPDMAMTLCTTLTTIDYIWNNTLVCELLARYCLPSTREKMLQFIADKNNDGPKRFPTFDTIGSVPWSTLQHAYGTAEDTPEDLRQLASLNPKTRSDALTTLINGITHQGQCYEATPYIVPFLIELVEATLVQDKDQILWFAISLLTDRTEYLYVRIEGLYLEADWRPYPDILQIRLAIEKNFMNELPRILGLLSNDSSSVRGGAAHLLAFLPKSAYESVPILREQYDTETDSKVKASILVALSLLWPQFIDDMEGWSPLIRLAQEQYKISRGMGALDLEFAAFVCLVRLYALDEKSIKRDIERFLMESDEISFKRESFVISNPKEFVLQYLIENKENPSVIPLVIQQIDSEDYTIARTACETMFELAFRSFRAYGKHPHLIGWISSPEQTLVVRRAENFYRDNHQLWDLQMKGFPHSEQFCTEYLEEAQVAADLYGE
eukprot:TRINITY_DN4438_c0_g1_i1.p1 TRINITY_DN4438_c0_g1~~TRINITY_DN4438_c0_g1_i1.p1  ORF type:complete len:777 (-),score=61.41 TRINITY_DN4438_c0_g1_i1:26-2356(-)